MTNVEPVPGVSGGDLVFIADPRGAVNYLAMPGAGVDLADSVALEGIDAAAKRRAAVVLAMSARAPTRMPASCSTT